MNEVRRVDASTAGPPVEGSSSAAYTPEGTSREAAFGSGNEHVPAILDCLASYEAARQAARHCAAVWPWGVHSDVERDACLRRHPGVVVRFGHGLTYPPGHSEDVKTLNRALAAGGVVVVDAGGPDSLTVAGREIRRFEERRRAAWREAEADRQWRLARVRMAAEKAIRKHRKLFSGDGVAAA